MILKPDQSQSFDCWEDADFSGNWNHLITDNDPSTSKSHTGWLITYTSCPISWASKMQTQVTLLMTEVVYIALSLALW